MDRLELLQELVSATGAPGAESRVRAVVARHLDRIGLAYRTDSKGNLIVGSQVRPRIVVTAHLDEIALLVNGVDEAGLTVAPLGGIHPWKLGEGPVLVQTGNGDLPGVLSFGSVHSEGPDSILQISRERSVEWRDVRVLTGLTASDVGDRVPLGSRVVVHPSRRGLFLMPPLVSCYFLDDRADLAVWLECLESLKILPENVHFVATASEEVGGEGALFYMHEHRPEICIALELAPLVQDAPIELSPNPVLWLKDCYSSVSAADIDRVHEIANKSGVSLQAQVLSRGGSDATCAASHGLCARPLTLGIPMRNSHGFEVMHVDAMESLAKLTLALLADL